MKAFQLKTGDTWLDFSRMTEYRVTGVSRAKGQRLRIDAIVSKPGVGANAATDMFATFYFRPDDEVQETW